MNTIEKNPIHFKELTRMHRMGAFPSAFQLGYGRDTLYFGFEDKQELNNALELSGGQKAIVRFREPYKPSKFETLTHPMPLVVPTDLDYVYLPRVGYELVTVKNAGKFLQSILDYCNAEFVTEPDWGLANRFMKDVKQYIIDGRERTYAIYFNSNSGYQWDLIEKHDTDNKNGMYFGVLVKGGQDGNV